MEQVLEGQPRQQPMHAAVRREQVVVEAGVDPRLEVLPAPVGVDVRRPRHRQRVHAELVLQLVRGVEAVLAARAGNQAVVVAVVAAVPVAQLRAAAGARSDQSTDFLMSATRHAAHTPFVIELHRRLARVDVVLELLLGVRLLVAVAAACAEANLARQAVERVGLGESGA